jgi:hypothetical protein
MKKKRGNGPIDEELNVTDMRAWRAAREKLEEPKLDDQSLLSPLDLSELSSPERRIAEWTQENFHRLHEYFDQEFDHFADFLNKEFDSFCDQLNKEFGRYVDALNRTAKRSDTDELAKHFDELRTRLIPFVKELRSNDRVIARLEARVKKLEARRAK